MEKTLVILKPDCVARRLAGRVIQRFEEKGLQLAGLRLIRVNTAMARKLYAVHKGKPFYEPLVKFITSGPVIVMCLRGKDAVAVVRKMLGNTFGPEAPAGTIRGDFGMSKRYNLVHGSDSPANARKELAIFFKNAELIQTDPVDLGLTYDITGPEML